MNSYILTPDARIVAAAVFLAAAALSALAIRLADDLRSTRRKDSASLKRDLRNAAEWDRFRGRRNPRRLPIEKL